MKAIILAAGRGSRMKNLTDERPKCLVELHGKALLEWQLEGLRKAGIREVGIVTGYKRELLKEWNLEEFYNARWAETQMVSSLMCASKWLQQGPCIVSYSDIFYDTSAVQKLIESSADIAVTYDPNWLELWVNRFGDPLLDAETFQVNTDGTLAEIGNKPKTLEEVRGQYMGLLRFTTVGWKQLEFLLKSLCMDGKDKMHMTRALQMILDHGKLPISAIPINSSWGEIDSGEDLNVYENQQSIFEN